MGKPRVRTNSCRRSRALRGAAPVPSGGLDAVLAHIESSGISVAPAADVAELADALDSKFGRWRPQRVSFRFTQHACDPHGYWSEWQIVSKRLQSVVDQLGRL